VNEMVSRGLVGLIGGLCVLLTGKLAQAQCTKDTDCKGDRVCAGGACVAPEPAALPPPSTAAPAATSPAVQGSAGQIQKAIGFSNLVFRLERGDTIGIAGEDFRIHILEDLRRRGLNAVGAENLVFGSDAGGAAELLLGGTVSELECKPGLRQDEVSCRLGVEWQVLDRSSDSVVYKVTTRGSVNNFDKDPPIGVGRQLIRANLNSLTSRPRFRRLLVPEPVPVTASGGGYSAATMRACSAAARTMPTAAEQVLDSTVLIQTSTGFGSGFVASTDGFVLTAAHVISGSAATVRLRDGRELPATVIRSDRRLDIALLRVAVPQGVTLSCLPMKLGPVAVGSDAYAIGAPARRELSFSVARGIVSGIRLLDGVQYLQTDAAVNRGNSGGPLVNASGEAVGIVSTKLVGATVEGIAFGVPLNAGLDAIAVRSSGGTSTPLISAGPIVAQISAQTVVDQADPVPGLAEGALRDHGVPGKRHSKGMMAGGIVMVSFAPIALVVAAVGGSKKSACERIDGGDGGNYDCSNYDASLYGGLLSAVALAAVGVPLIVIGAKRVPANEDKATARITPWATRRAAGIGLRVDL
jgi:S1-C subfamily serine protease